MSPLLAFVIAFAVSYVVLFPVFLLREYLRPDAYDWPVWIWRLRLAAAARLHRRPYRPRRTAALDSPYRTRQPWSTP